VPGRGAGASLNSVFLYSGEVSFLNSGLDFGFLERGGRSRGSPSGIKEIEGEDTGAIFFISSSFLVRFSISVSSFLISVFWSSNSLTRPS
jgi:hypothetical protein